MTPTPIARIDRCPDCDTDHLMYEGSWCPVDPLERLRFDEKVKQWVRMRKQLDLKASNGPREPTTGPPPPERDGRQLLLERYL